MPSEHRDKPWVFGMAKNDQAIPLGVKFLAGLALARLALSDIPDEAQLADVQAQLALI